MRTRLQELRKAAGFKSAKAFADYMNMSVGTYTDYEQGRRTFSLDKAWDFCDALGCTLDELAGREWPPSGQARPPDGLAPDERLVLDAMGRVNEDGRAKILDDASLVAESPRYAKSAQGESAGAQGA